MQDPSYSIWLVPSIHVLINEAEPNLETPQGMPGWMQSHSNFCPQEYVRWAGMIRDALTGATTDCVRIWLHSSSPVMLRLGETCHLHLPSPDLTIIKQDAGSAPEVLIPINRLVAAPAEVGSAAATDHVTTAGCLLDCHLASWALL